MFLLKLLALLAQNSSQPADLSLFRNVGPHGGRIKQYGCTPHGCTVLEVVDHSGLEDAEVYRVTTLPGLRLFQCTLQWCEGLLPCLFSCSLPKMPLLSYRGGTKHLMGAISHSPDSVRGHAASQQAGTAVSLSDSSAKKLFRSKSQIPPKPMATLLPTCFRAGVSPLSAEASSVI